MTKHLEAENDLDRDKQTIKDIDKLYDLDIDQGDDRDDEAMGKRNDLLDKGYELGN